MAHCRRGGPIDYREAYFTMPMAALQRVAFSVIGIALAAYYLPRAAMLLLTVLQEPESRQVS